MELKVTHANKIGQNATHHCTYQRQLCTHNTVWCLRKFKVRAARAVLMYRCGKAAIVCCI